EPVRRRRRSVREPGRQEPDLDHPRTRDAHLALHRSRKERWQAMSEISRREWIAAMGAAAVVLRPTEAQAKAATDLMRSTSGRDRATPRIYTEHEWQTVRILVDYIFPADERSGSATDAKVPEFMDTMLYLEPGMRTAHRGGLAWLDT